MTDIEDLMPFQEEGAAWLVKRKQAMLADEMGLGKTCQAIRACDMIGADNILVICKTNAVINWSREFAKFSFLDRPIAMIRSGDDRPARGVTIVSYDYVAVQKAKRAIVKAKLSGDPEDHKRADIARRIERNRKKLIEAIKAIEWDVLIIDEAHFLKERDSSRTRQVYGDETARSGIIHSAKRCWRLTGTPVLNYADELWTHLKSSTLYSQPYWDFVFQFCSGFDGDYGYKITGNKNEGQLKQMIAPFVLRRKKDDVMKDLPPITFSTVTVDRAAVSLDPWFYEQYHVIGQKAFVEKLKVMETTLKNAMDLHLEDSKYRNHDLTLKMLESYSTSVASLRRYIGLAKMKSVLEIISEELAADAYEKIVIFAVHQQVIEHARLALAKFRPVTLYGGTPLAKRQDHIDKFQNTKRCRVFIGQIIAAGDSITLTAASEVAFMEADWVPANNAQAAARCHRIGQTKPVRARFFVCAGTVDEDVMRVVAHKTRQIAKIFD